MRGRAVLIVRRVAPRGTELVWMTRRGAMSLFDKRLPGWVDGALIVVVLLLVLIGSGV